MFWQTREKLHFHSNILHSYQKISGIVRFWYPKCAVSPESVRNDLPPWNTSFIVFALTRPTIVRTRGEHANYYATDAVYYLWTETKVPMQWLHHTKQNIQHSEIWRIAADWIIHAKHMVHFFPNWGIIKVCKIASPVTHDWSRSDTRSCIQTPSL